MKENIFPSINPAIIKKINKAESILIIAHKNPDGDALSSTLALASIMRRLGKSTYPVNEGPFLRSELSDLAEKIHSEIPESIINQNPLVIVADCSTADRPGEIFNKINHLDRIVIDHHSTGNAFTPSYLSYIVPESPSTTILVDILRGALGVSLDEELASYLYTGLATDTGFFHFISKRVGEEVFTRAASYVRAGVDPYIMYDKLTDGKDFAEVLNSAEIIKTTQQYFDGKLLIAMQPSEIADMRISDEIYPQLLKVKNVKAVILLKQRDGKIVIGFRAKRNAGIDVGEIAHAIGGGGHKLAAGAESNKSISETIKILIDLFSSVI